VARAIATGVTDAAEAIDRLAGLGIDMDEVDTTLEEQDAASFRDSFARAPGALEARNGQLAHS
jgi:hypothetical protein